MTEDISGFNFSGLSRRDADRVREQAPRAIRAAMMGEDATDIIKEIRDTTPQIADADGIRLVLPLLERTLVTSTASAAGNLLFPQPQGFIDLLRVRSVTGAAGATYVTGLNGASAKFARQTTAGSAAWRSENPGSDDTSTDSTFDQLTLTPKLVQRTATVSRQLLAQQGTYDVDGSIKQDLAAVLALAMDYGAIQGGGTNEPVGLLSDTNISTVTLGANGGTITFTSLLDARYNVSSSSGDIGNLAWVSNPTQERQLSRVQGFSTNAPLLTDGRVFGKPFYSSTQMPKNLTKGTSTTICSGIIYGNWSECFVGVWGDAVEFIIDPYAKRRQALIEITAALMGDVGARHAASFSVLKDAL